jgi:hypothetical protein
MLARRGRQSLSLLNDGASQAQNRTFVTFLCSVTLLQWELLDLSPCVRHEFRHSRLSG